MRQVNLTLLKILSIIIFLSVFHCFSLEPCYSSTECINIGKEYLDIGDLNSAATYFNSALTNAQTYGLTDYSWVMTAEDLDKIGEWFLDISYKYDCGTNKAVTLVYASQYYDYAAAAYLNNFDTGSAKYSVKNAGVGVFEALNCLDHSDFVALLQSYNALYTYVDLSTRASNYFTIAKQYNAESYNLDSDFDNDIDQYLIKLNEDSTSEPTVDPWNDYEEEEEDPIVESPKKENGQSCTSNEECLSNHCQNFICCVKGETCCSSNLHCGSDKECDNERRYCVKKEVNAIEDLKEEPTPEAEVTPELSNNGDDCQKSSECVSNNCKQGICCKEGNNCCEDDSGCNINEECNLERYYCVPKVTQIAKPDVKKAKTEPTTAPKEDANLKRLKEKTEVELTSLELSIKEHEKLGIDVSKIKELMLKAKEKIQANEISSADSFIEQAKLSIKEIKRSNGQSCIDNSMCISNNCGNGMCCITGEVCCKTNADCSAEEECNEQSFYCEEKGGLVNLLMTYKEIIAGFFGIGALISGMLFKKKHPEAELEID